jgi:hypothetical protein
MNIISHFNKILEESFNNFLKKYFYESNFWHKTASIDNYIDFMTDFDNFNYSFMINVIKSYFEYIDEIFFNTSYRKNFCVSKGFYSRTILTLFGEITFKRRYYLDKNDNERFYFTDYFLNIPKRKYFDPFICANICEEAASYSYSKAGKIVADRIGKKINNNIYISRASARNVVMQFKVDNAVYPEDKKRIEKLFIMLDEKFVGSQFNDKKDHMIKAAILFEGTELVYKSKRKANSIDRYRLVNSHTCASIENELLIDTVNYIYNTYDVDSLKEINFMGDCALWIKKFPKSSWFRFDNNIKVNFSMDGFHFSQALNDLTTQKYDDVYDALYEYVSDNNKNDFIRLCNEFLDLFPERQEVIESKKEYILNNWNERQFYLNHPYLKCSMESHISHIFADLFTSRPKAYSKKGLRQLLKIRLLKVNNKDIKKMYFNNFRNKEIKVNYPSTYYNEYNNYSSEINYYNSLDIGNFDNYINFI